MSALYKTQVIATEGRHGHVKSSDGLLDLALAIPKEMGGKGDATNPEQLFAAGYAACFENAVIHLAKKQKILIKDADVSVIADISLHANDQEGFDLAVSLTTIIHGLSQRDAEELVQAAHAVCPYSNAIKGNIDVVLNTQGKPFSQTLGLNYKGQKI